VILRDNLRRNFSFWARLSAVAIASLVIVSSIACNSSSRGTGEYVYVSAPKVNLRDRIAAVYNKVGTVKNGDRLTVLERQKRFVRVRTANGEEGWIEQRYVVSEDIYKGFDKLAADNKNAPVQGKGVARNELNMHLTPAREGEALYRLAEGEKVDILKRATAERPQKDAPLRPVSKPGAKAEEAPPKIYDDFWLVRTAEGRYGWVLSRMIDLDVPLDVAQYAEGQRIQGAFVLNEVQDGDKKVPQYLVLLTEPRDGLPYDYNQARVFTWNLKKHRYETAYRERNFMGFFPVTVGTENFDKEGTLPTFTLRVQTVDGKIVERKYKLNQPIVRRVPTPGEDQVKLATVARPESRKAPEKKKRR
jgi:SH3-like domain-containing protein